jgi:hypothetical protein
MVGVNFLDPSLYSSGSFVPNGNYCVYHNVIIHQATDKNGTPKGPQRLGVMVDFYPFANPTEEGKLQQFYSMGTKAIEGFQPNPDTGKGIVAIPGASGSLTDKSNWYVYFNSLIQCGYPPSVGTNDLSVIDGVWVHINNEDEPAERASYQSATSEVSQEPRRVNKIAVVTEILEGGSPWENGGGLEGVPDAAAALGGVAAAAPRAAARTAPAPAARPAAARPAPVAAGRPAPVKAPAPAAVAEVEVAEIDQEVINAATDAVYNVLLKAPNGMPRATLKTQTFSECKKLVDEGMASTVISTYFEPGGEADLTNLLRDLNFAIVGALVKPVAA